MVDVAHVLGAGEGFEFFAGVELGACPVGEDHCAFGADDERAAAGQFVTFGHLCQFYWRLFAVVPCCVDCFACGVF